MRPLPRAAASLMVAALLLVPLSGCGDPLDRQGTWHAIGVNQVNLDTAAVDKRDTVIGHGDPGSDGVLDTAAVIRLHADQTRKLLFEDTQ